MSEILLDREISNNIDSGDHCTNINGTGITYTEQHFHDIKIPVAFDPQKLASLIGNFLKIPYFNSIEVPDEEIFKKYHRDLPAKNILNGVSEEYFYIIQDHFEEHFEDINRFLKHPANRTILKNYRSIASKLNMSYISSSSNKKNLPLHIQFVQEKVYNSMHLTDDLDDYLGVFLHHMYFYCDYGINPKTA
ncbi:MAG: ABC-three component system protein [Cetobacterium sp.]|uniref:ABC-three component system protein n=1 Tax=Cetobacterium sp. TaxID=2071632 RepID=UPI003EE6707C